MVRLQKRGETRDRELTEIERNQKVTPRMVPSIPFPHLVFRTDLEPLEIETVVYFLKEGI